MKPGTVKMLGVLLAAVLIVCGAVLIVWDMPTPSRTVDAASVTTFSNDAQTVYTFTDLMLADTYAIGDRVVYAVGVMQNASGALSAVSLELPVSDPVYTRLKTYLENDTAYYGDLVVSCCAQYVGRVKDDSQKAFYEDATTAIAAYYDALSQPFEATTHHFRYLCADDEDYSEHLGTATVKPLLGVGLILLAGFCVIQLLRKPKTPPIERQHSTEL